MGVSSSDFRVWGGGWEGVETFRRGVDADAFGSFFLWERLPMLVRFGVEVPEERTASVAGMVG